jgi:hypothetical protein
MRSPISDIGELENVIGVAKRSGDCVPVLLFLDCCVPLLFSARSSSSASDRMSDSRSSRSPDSGFGGS